MKNKSAFHVFVVVLIMGCGTSVKLDPDVVPFNERVILSTTQLVDTAKSYGIDSLYVLISDSFLTIKLRKSPTIFVLDENLNAYDLNICNAHFPDFNSMVLEGLDDESISEEQTMEINEMFGHLSYESGVGFQMKPNGKKSIFLSFGGYSPTYSFEMGHYIDGLGAYDPEEYNLYLMTNCNYVELGLSNEEFLELCGDECRRIGVL